MDTQQLFAAALGLSAPWQIQGIDFEADAGDGRGELVIRLDFERGGRFQCPECDRVGPAHDTSERRWRHLDFFQHTAFLVARVPRMRCDEHGVRAVDVPWARPGSGFTLLFEALVMALAAEMPMAALARMVREHDTRLWRIVRWHVEDARSRVDMSTVRELVVDETSQAKRQRYVTLFLEPKRYAADITLERPARVLHVAQTRHHTVFHEFAERLSAQGGDALRIEEVCMDMSPSYQRGVAETMPLARITFDRFHVMKLVGMAVDDVRRRERKLEPDLRHTRYDWLLAPSRLSARRRERIERLSERNLLTAKAYQMRLTLRELWEQRTPAAARRHLGRWCTWVLRAARRPTDPERPWVLEKMRTVALTLREHAEGVLRYLHSHLTSAVIEGVNSLAQAARARARGYRNPDTFKTMIYLIAGRLRYDLPQSTHCG